MTEHKYYIGPEGPRDARLAIVAEKPGPDELALLLSSGTGRPLIGASGREVDAHLRAIGSNRSEVYLTNAVKHFTDPRANPSEEDIQNEQPALYRELSLLPNLRCIVCMGQAALLSLSNFHLGDILRRRGSLYSSAIGTKMVPTLHPAFYMRGEWRYKPIVRFDLQRALEQTAFPDIRRPPREYALQPTIDEAIAWLRSLDGARRICFDIELFKGGHISCIAFATSRERAFCIPIMHGNRQPYWDAREECVVWREVQRVFLQAETEYIAQNGLFDTWHLWRHGIETPYMAKGFDTLYAHRLIAPELPHKLEFLCSIYTEEPFYKDESGRWDSEVRVPDLQFWTYNCKDAAIQLEVAEEEQEELTESGQLDYYRTYMQGQWDAITTMRKGGIRVNKTLLNDIRRKLQGEVSLAEEELREHVGWSPNVKSYLDMERLFEQYRVPFRRTPTGRPSSNEKHMLEYIRMVPPEGQRALGGCLEITRRRTQLSGFLSMALDPRDFYHPSLDISHAVSGRASSEGADEGGPQIQNIPKSLRKIFIPDDEESEITQADLKQAEAMFVAWDAREESLISAFEEGKDVHSVLGCRIYRDWTKDELPPDDLIASILRVCDRCRSRGESECNHSERYMSKQSGHAFRYKMGVRRFLVEQAAKGVYLYESEGKRIRDRVITPAIQRWQDRGKLDLESNDWIELPCGRKRRFSGLLVEDMIRKYLSWRAQSHVSHVTNLAMCRLHTALLQWPGLARILTQTHDSLVVTHKKYLRPVVSRAIDDAFDQTYTIHGRPLRIPIDTTHGPNWGDQK